MRCRVAAGVLAWGLWSGAAVAADCLAPVTSAQVDEALARAEAAWTASDDSGFAAALQEVDVFDVPCLAEPLRPSVVSRLHLVHGLAAFAARSPEDAVAAMHAARHLAPDFTLRPELLPPGHELATAYAAPDLAPARTVRVATPAHGSLYFDGTESHVRPLDRPTLAQLADRQGVVSTSAYLWPRDPMPAYARKPVLRNALAITAGVTGAAFASLFGASFATRQDYFDSDPSDGERLTRLRSATAGLAGAGIVFGVVGLGTGVASVAIGPR